MVPHGDSVDHPCYGPSCIICCSFDYFCWGCASCGIQISWTQRPLERNSCRFSFHWFVSIHFFVWRLSWPASLSSCVCSGKGITYWGMKSERCICSWLTTSPILPKHLKYSYMYHKHQHYAMWKILSRKIQWGK